jgi:hypothetical protein
MVKRKAKLFKYKKDSYLSSNVRIDSFTLKKEGINEDSGRGKG